MNFIELIHEPKRLLLVWQGPEGTERSRCAVAELLRAGSEHVRLRYLTDTPAFAKAQAEGFITFPAFRKLDATYELGVVETFMRRLPPRSRGDYAQYLEQFRLKPETPITDFALLGYTGAKLPSDGFSIVDPLDDVGEACDVLIEIAGFRHASARAARDLVVGEPVRFVPDVNNTFDPLAVAIEADGCRLGFVPRQQAPAIREILNSGAIEASIERVNGRPERPVVYVFTRLHVAAASRISPKTLRT